MSEETRYFRHRCGLRDEPKVLKLREKFVTGYGIYLMLLEMMCGEKDNRLQHDLYETYANEFKIYKIILADIIKTCIELEMFASDGIYFWANESVEEKPELESESE